MWSDSVTNRARLFFQAEDGIRDIGVTGVQTCGLPIFEDETFHGTIICSIVPLMWLAPGGPLVENAERAIKREETQTGAQWASHHLAVPLEENIAFLKMDELDTRGLLKRIALPHRPTGPVLPPLPP